MDSLDWEAQLHECLAQSSIMQEGCFRCWLDGEELARLTVEATDVFQEEGCRGRRLSCIAAVHLPLPEAGMTLQVSKQDVRSSGEAGPVVRHLPPLMLRAAFPPGYPSEVPPDVQLLADWLAPIQIRLLQTRLGQLWEEQGPGAPVLYTWIDWLEGCALQSLGIGNVLALVPAKADQPAIAASQPVASNGSQEVRADEENIGREEDISREDGSCRGDQASCSSSADGEAEEAGGSWEPGTKPEGAVSGVDALLARLLHYNSMREADVFRQGTHTCGVCLEELPGTHFVRPSPGCDHAFCGGCLHGLCAVHVAEGTLDALRCPLPECKAPFSRQRLDGVLGKAKLARWEELELAQTLQRMPDVVYCPRCSAACLEDGDANMAQCARCLFAFCSLCNDSWHPGVECMTAETKLKLLRARMAGARESVAELRRKELEYLSLVRIQETSKRCPACGMAIQKVEGCNKMTCSCGAFFCWRCQKQVEGYEHFRTGRCVLFEVADIQEWEMRFNMQIAEQRANDHARNLFWRDVGGPNARIAPCPSCGQHNTKTHSNNHMRCWACGAHFCYLCKQSLKGLKGAGGLHFGKGKCLQHSPN